MNQVFLPFQHAVVRMGYELKDVRPQRRLKFANQDASSWAWHNYKQPHTLTLHLKDKTKGVFTKKHYVEVVVQFSDWCMAVSAESASVWQEIADKLQFMLSSPETCLPLAPPASPSVGQPNAGPRQPLQVVYVAAPPATPSWLATGASVQVRWNDGQVYRGRVTRASHDGAEVSFLTGEKHWIPLGALSPEAALPAVSKVQHTIERQVVVARCRYCGQLTPVDGQACSSCGAGQFC